MWIYSGWELQRTMYREDYIEKITKDIEEIIYPYTRSDLTLEGRTAMHKAVNDYVRRKEIKGCKISIKVYGPNDVRVLVRE